MLVDVLDRERMPTEYRMLLKEVGEFGVKNEEGKNPCGSWRRCVKCGESRTVSI